MDGDGTAELMTDADFESALEKLAANPDTKEVADLLKSMNESRIISYEEAEQLMQAEGEDGVVKCGLKPTSRPSEPENRTDVYNCIERIARNDPTLTEVNLNNMKRTAIPDIQRLISGLKNNTYLTKLQLANTALSDAGAEPLIDLLENNRTLKSVNLETNFLSGECLAKIFKAAIKLQTLEEIKCVNQSTAFSTETERSIVDSVKKNYGLLKVSINLRMPEGRHYIEQCMLRNGDLKRKLRREIAAREAATPNTPAAATAEKITPAAAPLAPIQQQIPPAAAAVEKTQPEQQTSDSKKRVWKPPEVKKEQQPEERAKLTKEEPLPLSSTTDAPAKKKPWQPKPPPETQSKQTPITTDKKPWQPKPPPETPSQAPTSAPDTGAKKKPWQPKPPFEKASELPPAKNEPTKRKPWQPAVSFESNELPVVNSTDAVVQKKSWQPKPPPEASSQPAAASAQDATAVKKKPWQPKLPPQPQIEPPPPIINDPIKKKPWQPKPLPEAPNKPLAHVPEPDTAAKKKPWQPKPLLSQTPSQPVQVNASGADTVAKRRSWQQQQQQQPSPPNTAQPNAQQLQDHAVSQQQQAAKTTTEAAVEQPKKKVWTPPKPAVVDNPKQAGSTTPPAKKPWQPKLPPNVSNDTQQQSKDAQAAPDTAKRKPWQPPQPPVATTTDNKAAATPKKAWQPKINLPQTAAAETVVNEAAKAATVEEAANKRKPWQPKLPPAAAAADVVVNVAKQPTTSSNKVQPAVNLNPKPAAVTSTAAQPKLSAAATPPTAAKPAPYRVSKLPPNVFPFANSNNAAAPAAFSFTSGGPSSQTNKTPYKR